MRYFKKEDFYKCMEFLAGKPDTVETQQELYKFMHEECHMLYVFNLVTTKNMEVYSKVLTTRTMPKTANWSKTMSDSSQVVWNRKYQEFYWIDEVGMDHCDCLNYLSMFPEIRDIDEWLLENWSSYPFRFMQRQLVDIFNGRFNQYYMNLWK